MRKSLAAVIALSTGFALQPVSAQDGAFRTRNLSPLITIFGLPTWQATADSFQLSLTSELANHYRLSERGPDKLILDGETWYTNLSFAAPLGQNWSVSAEVPYYRHYGGVLDDVVDAWHSAFSLPDGGRNNRPEASMFFMMEDGRGVFYELPGRASGFGDARVSISRRIARVDGLHLTGYVKLPTGDEDILAGSGSADWALALLRQRPATFRNRAASLYWGFGLLRLGEAERIRFDQTRSGYTAIVGGSWQFARNLGLKMQIDMHSALYRSQLEEIGEDAWQGSIGGWWEFGQRGTLDFAFNEDLEVSTSPDIVVHIGARWRW